MAKPQDLRGKPRSKQGGAADRAKAKTTLAVSVSAVMLLVIGAIITPIGSKLVGLVWPDEGQRPAATVSNQSAIAAASIDGCHTNGSALSVTLTYDFTGGRWWATKNKLPDDIAGQLDSADDPSKVLAPYQPVEMEWDAGSLLKLVVTGCGPSTVTITNMKAAIAKRDKPLDGSRVSWPPQGNLEVTALAFDLDSPRPAALTYDWITSRRGNPYFVAHAVQVAKDESVPFAILGQTTRSYVEWTVTIEALVGGQPWQFTVSPPAGQVIRSTAKAARGYRSDFFLSNSTGKYEPAVQTPNHT